MERFGTDLYIEPLEQIERLGGKVGLSDTGQFVRVTCLDTISRENLLLIGLYAEKACAKRATGYATRPGRFGSVTIDFSPE
ncbi:MAG: hypothetical protein HY225_03565 [Candidatus Vogelbacteria bacterium]|nr:hypothetical protein [Candidatus Vogelbacteria bacterium]